MINKMNWRCFYMENIKNKVGIITGASSGIGKATVKN